jgi:anaerobic magnesium-protoporphyrin IX monomethyl ester cyclase
MKVMFIQPPIEDFYDTSIRTYPLGLLYIASKVSEIVDVSVLDMRSTGRTVINDHGFPELDEFYRTDRVTPFSLFGHYRRYGINRAEIRRAISRAKPDMVGISSMCSAYEAQATEVATLAKEVDPSIVTVLGGIHPTLFAGHVLAHPSVDYCIRGEGETAFYRLVSAIKRGNPAECRSIEGVCFKENNKIHLSGIAIEDTIDALPARQLIVPTQYRIGKKPYTFFLTSRGCPHNCGFCGKPPVPYRRRSLKSIEQEIEQCLELGIEAIDFEDDMLNLDKSAFTHLLGLLSHRDITLSAMNGIYPGNMDVATLQAMGDSGFRRLNFSLVDLAPSVLNAQNRRQQQSFIALMPHLETSPFSVEVHFIIGLPDQSPKDVMDTIVFLMGKRLLLGPSMFYISPGSPYYENQLHDGGSHNAFRLMRSSVMLPANIQFPRPVTYAFMKLVRFINYVKGLIDRHEGLNRLSDLIDNKAAIPDEHSRYIFKCLLHDKNLIWYNTAQNCFVEEPAEQMVITSFFKGTKGRIIKGFQTSRSIMVDV